MGAIVDLYDQRFGRLLVIGRAGKNGQGGYRWRCLCDCGRETVVSSGSLRSKSQPTASCGCLRIERTKAVNSTHRLSRTRTYRTWAGMLDRCRSPSTTSYKYYGGRGIRVCEHWMSFENFLADMGEAPLGLSIDRKDNDGNYEPGNCRWATKVEQANNQRPGGKRREGKSA